jgi:hypothetical protein
MADDYFDLAASIGELLQECLEKRGFQLPLHVAAVSANGTAMIARYTEGHTALDVTILAEHVEDPGYALPINMMFCDTVGNAARALIDKPNIKPQLLH